MKKNNGKNCSDDHTGGMAVISCILTINFEPLMFFSSLTYYKKAAKSIILKNFSSYLIPQYFGCYRNMEKTTHQ